MRNIFGLNDLVVYKGEIWTVSGIGGDECEIESLDNRTKYDGIPGRKQYLCVKSSELNLAPDASDEGKIFSISK